MVMGFVRLMAPETHHHVCRSSHLSDLLKTDGPHARRKHQSEKTPS